MTNNICMMPSDIISLLRGTYFINLALTSSHSGCIRLQLQRIWAAKLRRKKKIPKFLSFSIGEWKQINRIRLLTLEKWERWQIILPQVSFCILSENLEYIPQQRLGCTFEMCLLQGIPSSPAEQHIKHRLYCSHHFQKMECLRLKILWH